MVSRDTREESLSAGSLVRGEREATRPLSALLLSGRSKYRKTV